MRRRGYTGELIEKKRNQIRLYAKHTLSKKFLVDTEFTEDAVNAIAIATFMGDRSCEVWLNGELVNLKNLSLNIQLCPKQQENALPKS